MTNKLCNCCKVKKPFSEFYNKKNGKFGLNGRCKVCLRLKRIYNPVAIAKYREKNKELFRQKAMNYYNNNRELRIASVKKSNLKHKEKRLAYSRKYELENKEARLLKSRLYSKNNPEKVSLVNIKRRVKEKKCTPIWCDTKKLRRIYTLRNRLNVLAGYTKYHVDHIIPLNAKLATGLHVIENLAITLASYNMSKKNKFDVMKEQT